MYTQEMIKASTYEGWVAWVDGTPVLNPATHGLIAWDGCVPLFEEAAPNPLLAQVSGGMRGQAVNFGDRQTVDWKTLPHERVCTLELYAFRHRWPNDQQPLVRLDRNVNRDVRWIQWKRRALTLQAGVALAGKDGMTGGQQRTGIISYRMGYWDRTVGQCEMVEYYETGKMQRWEHNGSNHPCWDRPLGFGLAPEVLGLTAADVPPMPSAFAAAGGM